MTEKNSDFDTSYDKEEAREKRLLRHYNLGLLTIGLLPAIALNTPSWYGKETITTTMTVTISVLIFLLLGLILILVNTRN